MKKLTLLFCLLITANVYGQQVPPQGINFQAVLFDEFGTPVPSLNENSTLNNQSAEAIFTFYNFSSGLNYYIETHSISTDEFGRFQVVLGRGTPLGSNTFQDIQWSDGNIFLDFEVSIDGQANRLISSQELLSVPYALFSGGVTGASDLDPDPNNEIQELALDADSIYITKGNAIPIPLDGDKSSSNELQSLSINGNTITLSNGNTVSLPPVLDTSPTNELQSLSTQGDSLTISNGNTVLIDTSPTNELQSLSTQGDSLTLSNGNTVLIDPSSTNELQVLSIQGGDLTITIGNTVTLPVSLDNDSTNELQSILLTQSGHLKLSNSTDSVKMTENKSSAGQGYSGLATTNTSEYCYQGNPESFNLNFLTAYSNIVPLVVFDSIAFISAKNPSNSVWYVFRVNLYSGVVLNTSTFQQKGAVQSDSIGYIIAAGKFYTVDKSGFIDTTNYTGFIWYNQSYAHAYPNSDLTFSTSANGTSSPNKRVNYDYTTGTISTIVSSLIGGQTIGNDSILIQEKLYNKNTMVLLRTFNNAVNLNYNSSGTLTSTTFGTYYVWNDKYNKIAFAKHSGYGYVQGYTCDLTGGNEMAITNNAVASWDFYGFISNVTIDGINMLDGLGGNKYNRYFVNSQAVGSFTSSTFLSEDLGLDISSGSVYPILKPGEGYYLTKGKYTVDFSTGFRCVSGSSANTYYSLIRWFR